LILVQTCSLQSSPIITNQHQVKDKEAPKHKANDRSDDHNQWSDSTVNLKRPPAEKRTCENLQGGQRSIHEEETKELVIAEAHAVADPGAVVVHFHHTLVAN